MDPLAVIDTLRKALKGSDGDKTVPGLAIALVRLDQLHQINERIGYKCAGLLLDEFEERVRRFARRQDVVIPLERHKFGVVMRGLVNVDHLELAATKLQRMFEPPIDVLNESVRVSINAGLVPVDADSTDAEQLLRCAEVALHSARALSRCYVIGGAQTAPSSPADWTFQQELEGALAAGEFVLYFQPKVHAGFASQVGAEALLRWHSPKRGVVMPATFIGVAERSALIRPLTWFVIKSAIAQCSGWPADLSVAVNIAPSLLDDREIVDVVSDTLAIFGLPASRLTLEVTESSIMNNPAQAFTVLSALRAMNVQIAIDDFGTGYSSLSYFRDIPANELKIDRSFVSNMFTSANDAHIVKAIIDLAHTFALKVVAEGVEDAATAAKLHAMGCDVLQGYLISKPLPAADYQAWLARKLGDTNDRRAR